MNWCPVEWPTRSPGRTAPKIQAGQAGRQAARAGLLGILVLILLAAAVVGYARWSGRLAWPAPLRQAGNFLKETVTGEVPVTLTVDGHTKAVRTTARSVQEVLARQGVVLQPDDLVTPAQTVLLKKDMAIKVTRVTVKTITQETAVPYITERIANPELPGGFTRLVKKGQPGRQRETWRIRYEDGREVSRTCVDKEIIQEPVNGLLQYGTGSNVSRGGQWLRVSRSLDMLATGYTYTGNHTATGSIPGPGVAAVDPNVIPLGSSLYVEGYGRATALDTGGDIKGNRIDLFYDTKEAALRWGVRKTRVYVLE
ncbi:3D domain-containing protein [Desulforamulus hydrothermalis]|uniref:3D domain protein n=1 Tax=Desulforamulus hydrothermalis Lam5 = DSM 18033 TaxID=1121428 RepID=K8DZM3_9FIRM|nr:3D domain-containing protein [Desulforamulus hydrothermalis]CCO08572.1 3D domain protein [Desulforamulus hydrothermalis Lam5 = DSM 18033]SHH01965.1 protein of unknown function [Desulforamulus hydrothermalis Lam5 = DSM 18033]